MSKVTTDQDEIRRWVEERGGHPAHVKGTNEDEGVGILRIDYPGFSGEDTLEQISWEEFFKSFEENKLAFLYDDDKESRFSKLISRDSGEKAAAGK